MSNKPPSSSPSVQIPKPKLTIPGSRERKLTVRGQDNILNKVRVASEATAGDAVDGGGGIYRAGGGVLGASLVRVQTSTDLSREDVTIMSVLSIGVAMAVTMSVWPFITPLRFRVSAMAEDDEI
ncbi:uncharacterized protein A4U43_C05F7490 [Asparagus officinalis]|uniref:Uncharacterized protein n=1 Tax=Asparagus officinalis TaxID=4686 RepID=A0A5P1EQM0_ASPOF|nr:uncharacterized protein A4U43_C05F7490 [Asparagus officinalis]